MGRWARPPLHQVAFRIGFPADFTIAQRVDSFQKSRGYLGDIRLAPDDIRPERGTVPHYILQHPDDQRFIIRVTHTDAQFIESAYTDWADFRQKVLDHLPATPISEENTSHDFIGLAYIDRLGIFPTQDESLPISKYLRVKMEGPDGFNVRKFEKAAWLTDYQMRGPGDLMRIEVQSEEPDTEGIEHLNVIVDRRIVGANSTPVPEFLDLAHRDTLQAFESLLQPDYLAYLKEGRDPNGCDFGTGSST